MKLIIKMQDLYNFKTNNTKITKEKEFELRGYLFEYQKLQKQLKNNVNLGLIEKDRIKIRCTEIKEIMLKEYIRLIKYFCKLYSISIDKEDALEESILTFFKAMNSYKLDSEIKFSTYFGNAIKHNLNRIEIENNQIVSFRIKLKNFIDIFKLENNREPNVEEIEKGLNIEHGEFLVFYNNMSQHSLEEPINEKGQVLSNIIEDNVPSLIDISIAEERQRLLLEAMKKTLKDYQYECIYLHFFCGKTYKEIGEIRSVSSQAVSGAIKKGKKKLKEYFKKSKHVEYFGDLKDIE